jgi:hypothetical protein
MGPPPREFPGRPDAKLLCGRGWLYSARRASILARASPRFSNQFAFEHSSRNFPSKLSM